MHNRVSVIILTYNSEKTIGFCLSSVCASSYIPEEVIIIDDSSRDNTLNIVKEFGAIVVTNNTHRRQAASRNIGASRARGDLLLFVDSDIELKKNSIEQALNTMSKTKAQAVLGLFDEFNPYNNIFSQYKNMSMIYNFSGAESPIKWTNTSFLLISKNAFFSIGGFDESLSHSVGEDVDFGNRLARKGNFIFLDKNLKVVHRRYLNFSDFVKMEYKRAKALTFINIKNLKTKTTTEWPVRLSFRITFLALPIFYMSLYCSFFSVKCFFASLLFLILFFVLNIKFIYFLFKRRGFLFSSLSFFILLFDTTICFITAVIELSRLFLFGKFKKQEPYESAKLLKPGEVSS